MGRDTNVLGVHLQRVRGTVVRDPQGADRFDRAGHNSADIGQGQAHGPPAAVRTGRGTGVDQDGHKVQGVGRRGAGVQHAEPVVPGGPVCYGGTVQPGRPAGGSPKFYVHFVTCHPKPDTHLSAAAGLGHVGPTLEKQRLTYVARPVHEASRELPGYRHLGGVPSAQEDDAQARTHDVGKLGEGRQRGRRWWTGTRLRRRWQRWRGRRRGHKIFQVASPFVGLVEVLTRPSVFQERACG